MSSGSRYGAAVARILLLVVLGAVGPAQARNGLGSSFVLLHGEESEADLERLHEQLGAVLVDEDVLEARQVEVLIDPPDGGILR